MEAGFKIQNMTVLFLNVIMCILYIFCVECLAKTPLLNVSKEELNKKHKSGEWQSLNTEPVEIARSSVIGVYYHMYGNRGPVLDVGCGEGFFTENIHKRKGVYTGIDISEVAINRAKQKRTGFDFQCANLSTYEPIRLYSTIIFNEVLYFVDHKKELIRYSKFLHESGKIIISLMSSNATSNEHDEIFSVANNLFSFLHSMSLSGLTTSTTTLTDSTLWINHYIGYFNIKVYQVKKK